MTTITPLILLTVIALTASGITGCDTARNIYKSSPSKTDYFTIKAVTLSHCGCSEFIAESFVNGRKEFQIFYNNNLARKTIYSYNSNSKIPEPKYLLATASDDFIIPFSDVDSKIFAIIDSAIVNKQGIIYPIRRTLYKGYNTDTLMQR